ncbi:MAG TPA: hypothetical protein VH682_17740 [Gemmataceae bacterium]
MPFPTPMPQLPQPGQLVHWRNVRHAHALGWVDAYGSGPFIAIGTVDKSHQGISDAVLLQTSLGEKEVNQVWLALAAGRGEDAEHSRRWEGYSPEVLLCLDA